MKFKKVIKRVTSTFTALALGIVTFAGAYAGAAADPNPTNKATNVYFSWTDGYLKYDAHAGYPFPNGTDDERMWIIKLNDNQPETVGNLCINPATKISSGTTDYYSYQVTDGSLEANSKFWTNLSKGKKYTIGLLMYYGYPNGAEKMTDALDATSGASLDATQMLIWEAVLGTRVLPDDYKDRTDYNSYANMQYHWTNGTRDYQYTPLRDLYYKLGAGGVVSSQLTSEGKAYYNYLVNKIVHHKDIPSITYTLKDDAEDFPITLKYNSATNHYEATITVNEALYNDFKMNVAFGNMHINATRVKQYSNGNADYNLWINPDAKFSGTRVSAKMDKQSTLAASNTSPFGEGLQIWAKKVISNNPDDEPVQQTVTGSQPDPVSAYVAVNVQEERGDITVEKKSYDVNSKVDAAIDAEVKTAARFVVIDESVTSSERKYVRATKVANGNYTYVASDRYSNTAATDKATIMELDADGKLKLTNVPLGKTFTVIEYQTGEHYKLNLSDTASRSVSFTLSELNPSQSKELGNYEEYSGKINIEKKDNLGNVLSEIEFGIYNASGAAITVKSADGNTTEAIANGALVEKVKTNAQGKASTTKQLPKATYKVKELSEVAPYVVNKTEQTVKLDGSAYSRTARYEQRTVQIENTIQQATLKIVKTDGATNQPIKNNPATFNVKVAEDYKINGKTILAKGKDIGTYTTDANGELTVKNIYVNAKYTVTETVPPTNYKKAAPITVTAAWDKTVEHVEITKSIKNDWQEGVINVYKYVVKNNTNKPLADAQFELKANEDINVKFEGKDFKYSKGDIVQTIKTDANGAAAFDRVPVGFKYIVREIAAPKGYKNDHPEKEITLKANAEVEFVETEPIEIENKETSLYISKRVLSESDDEKHINGTELKGAKMAIVDDNGDTVYTWTSDGKEHLIEGIEAGKYTLKELAAPDGYQVATDIEFTIDDQNKVTVTNATVESKDDIPLIVMFDEVTKTEISKKSATTGKELAGAELTLYDWNNNEVESWTSTDKPHVIYGLVVGKTYRLSENLAPIGYAKTTDVNFTVEGVDKNGKAIVTKVEMKDEIQIGGLYIYKKTPEQKNIANIEFGLKGTSTLGIKVDLITRTDENGVAKFENVPVGTYKLSENGTTVNTNVYIVSGDKIVDIKDNEITKVDIENIEKTGSITVQKQTEGNLNIKDIKFVLRGISDSGREIKINAVTDANGIANFTGIPLGIYEICEDGESVPSAYLSAEKQSVSVVYAKTTDITFFNKMKTGSVKIQKKTEGNLNIKDIKFILSGKADCGLDVEISATTDDKGVATFENVPIGTFEIVEDGKTVPVGYLVADKQSVKVEYAKTTDVEFYNQHKTGSIKIQKSTSDNSDKINNIKFVLSGKADCGLDVEISATTDDKGVATFENVPIGTFEIVEDGKTVPVGYLIAEPKKDVRVEYAKTTDVTFTNKPTEIEFSKQSATGSGELEGANLQLFDEKGKLVEEWTSGKNPHVIKGKLAAGGKYRLHESLAPIGYKVASDIEFTVNTDGKVQKVVMYDEAEEKPERPPQTGYTEHNPMVFVLLAGIALISVFSIFVKVSSKKKEDE